MILTPPPNNSPKLSEKARFNLFFETIGYSFKELTLLREALTHRSFGLPNNERLEFLGDSVLNCTISELLFKKFPTIAEGDLSRIRANLVNQSTLFNLALSIGIADLIRLGEGEKKSGGNNRPSILANALEAIIGAIFLEGGFKNSEICIKKIYAPLLQTLECDVINKDAKTTLQEYMQSLKLDLPEYIVLAVSGLAHRQKFMVECVIAKLNIRVVGEGTSRRRAEQDAARQAYALALQTD